MVGMGSVLGNNLMGKFLYLLRERRFVSPSDPRLAIPKIRIVYFLFWQVFAVAATVAISQTIGAIGFPVLIMSLIPFRWLVMPRIFTVEELTVLDAPTADNPVVLVSLGGMPELPEEKMKRLQDESPEDGESERGEIDEERMEHLAREQEKEREHGVQPQRAGQYKRE